MARWNKTLAGRLPQPWEIKELSECGGYNCYKQTPKRKLVVAARWPTTDEEPCDCPICPVGKHEVSNIECEYWCPACGLVFTGLYDGTLDQGTAPVFDTWDAAREWLDQEEDPPT